MVSVACADTLPEQLVTADRVTQSRDAVASHVTVLDGTDLEQSGAITLDDALRQVAGFSLFRRSGSLVAHPTTQGVSLRGLGGSGASRTLVLLDGIPLNDPFGGWIPWALVPMSRVDRVEIVRGPGTTAWGNAALGGVVNLVGTMPDQPTGSVIAEGGTHGTWRTEASAGSAWGPTAVALAAAHRATDGYPVIRADQRGRVDVPADSTDTAVDGRLAYHLTPDTVATVHLAALDEARGNGTPYTDNASQILTTDLTLRHDAASGDAWRLGTWSRVQRFESRFSAVGPRRAAERPSVDQYAVPVRAGGLSGIYEHPFTDTLRGVAGVDGSLVDSETHEDARFAGRDFTVRRRAGGQLLAGGSFASLQWHPLPALHLSLGGRVDVWQRRALFRTERTRRTGQVTVDAHEPDGSRAVPTPTFSARWAPAPWWSLRAGAAGGVRFPTLNELTRSFRVRQDVTTANPRLRPERSIGGEVGADAARGTVAGSATAYWIDVDDAIGNATVSGPRRASLCPGLPAGGRCAERRNLGTIESRGLELDGSWTFAPRWVASANYALQDTHVRSSDAPRLDGRRSPQVPLHGAVGRLAYDDPAGPIAAIDLRYVGRQYDDDRNRHPLGGFVTVDAHVGWHLGTHCELFLRAENLLDRTYPIARSDVTAIGAPRLVHGGVRLVF